MAKPDKWLRLKCQVCGQQFDFPECDYKPETCTNPECVKKNLHPELQKRAKAEQK